MNILYIIKEDPRIGLGHASQRARAFLAEWSKIDNTKLVFCYPTALSETIELYGHVGIGFKNHSTSILYKVRNLFLTHHFRQIKISSKNEILSRMNPFLPDIVVAEELACAELALSIGRHINKPVALVNHNLEYSLYSQIHPNNFVKRLSLYFMERMVLKKMDQVFSFSEVDKNKTQALYGLLNISSTKAGIHIHSPDNKIKKLNRRKIAFIGSLDYYPNIEGLQWFSDEIYPKITIQPAPPVIVMGKNPTDQVKLLCSKCNFELIDTPPSLQPFLDDVYLEIVPLRLGSGTRGKILEAAALKIPIVSTSLGAEGLELDNEKDILIADDPIKIANLINMLYENPSKAESLANSAFDKVSKSYSYATIVKDFNYKLSKLL